MSTPAMPGHIRWRALPDGWPYAVSETGHVRSFVTGRLRKAYRHANGRKYILLIDSARDRRIRSSIGRLVCLAFYGPPPDDGEYHASHLDGDHDNNHADNLRWESPKRNNWRKGKYANGELPPF